MSNRAAAPIRPRTVVFSPVIAQSTYLFCRNMKKNLEMVIMMNNDGRLTASVHIAEPQMLPVAV